MRFARSLRLTMVASSAMVDSMYPGTAVERMLASRERVSSLTSEALSGEWQGPYACPSTGKQYYHHLQSDKTAWEDPFGA